MKCYKCGGKTALIIINWIGNMDRANTKECICLPCTYELRGSEICKNIMPFTKAELDFIRRGEKWTSLRSLRRGEFPFEKVKIYIAEYGIREINKDLLYCSNITGYIVKSEGYKTFSDLIAALKKKGFKFPKEMWLYDLQKPLH